jgi:hypothetical protein
MRTPESRLHIARSTLLLASMLLSYRTKHFGALAARGALVASAARPLYPTWCDRSAVFAASVPRGTSGLRTDRSGHMAALFNMGALEIARALWATCFPLQWVLAKPFLGGTNTDIGPRRRE